jgi:hypothetical protein
MASRTDIRAMVRWRLGRMESARKLFDPAGHWREASQKLIEDDRRRLHAEAAALIEDAAAPKDGLGDPRTQRTTLAPALGLRAGGADAVSSVADHPQEVSSCLCGPRCVE